MIHLIWYIVVGLIAGLIAKSVLHVHMTIFWTIVLGIIGSIIGGALPTCFRRRPDDFMPPVSSFQLGGSVLFICLKLTSVFPRSRSGAVITRNAFACRRQFAGQRRPIARERRSVSAEAQRTATLVSLYGSALVART